MFQIDKNCNICIANVVDFLVVINRQGNNLDYLLCKRLFFATKNMFWNKYFSFVWYALLMQRNAR